VLDGVRTSFEGRIRSLRLNILRNLVDIQVEMSRRKLAILSGV
jgi:hypothetical protein